MREAVFDHMFYDEAIYTPEVHMDDEGFYRWRYTLDTFHDRQMYNRLIKIWAVIAVGGAVMGFLWARVPLALLHQYPSRYPLLLFGSQILHAILGYAVFFAFGLLVTGLVRLIEGGPSKYWYRMNDAFVQIQPSGKGSGINAFSEVKKVELFPDKNEIRLVSRWGKCPVLVRAEDFDLIRSHILTFVPKDAVIIDHGKGEHGSYPG